MDMDAFFAAVEQRDNETLRGKPVIVGGIGRRGVVSTASYEARVYGVHSAMSMAEARRLCPHGVFLACDHDKYAKVSTDIQQIFAEFSPLIEPLSLDEAFLDVSGMEWLYSHPEIMAKDIKRRIKEELKLIVSAGVAPNKFLAKLASDLGKPDGLLVIEPGEEENFLKDIPITRLWGVGAATARKLETAGFTTIGRLANASPDIFVRFFGNSAEAMRALTHGKDHRPVVVYQAAKSVGNEITFDYDITVPERIETHLLALSQKVGRRLRQANLAGRTITVKMRLASFETHTRSRTLPEATFSDEVIYHAAQALVGSLDIFQGVRLIGVSVSNLGPWTVQPVLFSEEKDTKHLNILKAMDNLKDRFGEAAVTRARLLSSPSPDNGEAN
ncbi:MAG: polymerase [Firmicutes bacterium]|nr:polymerase [Bacillota bacterium]